MFKTIKHIKKKILAAAMAVAILVSGNIGQSSMNSDGHSITDTTVKVSAATVYVCKYSSRGCPTKKKLKESIIKHEKHCPYKPKTYTPCKYSNYGCPRTFTNAAERQQHEADCPFQKGKACTYCNKRFKDLDKYNTHITYDCKENPNRQISEGGKSDLHGLNPPRWDIYDKSWICPYCYASYKFEWMATSHIYAKHPYERWAY